MVKLVLGLFYTQEGVGFWVVKKYQVSQHLNGAIRHKGSKERVFKRAILKLQEYPPFLCGFGL